MSYTQDIFHYVRNARKYIHHQLESKYYITKISCVLVILHERRFPKISSVFQEKVYGCLRQQVKLKKERGNDPLNKLTSTDN